MSDRDELAKFEQKSFRDGYLQTTTRGGIAYQIQALREKTGLTQTEFAQKLDKKQSTISRLESSEYGKVTVQTLLDIACSLDVALLVRFVSYPEFLTRTKDFALAALQPDTIFESIAAEAQAQQRPAFGGGARAAAAQNVEQWPSQNAEQLNPQTGWISVNDNSLPPIAAAFRHGANNWNQRSVGL